MHFLEKVADYIFKNYPEDPGKVSVILPNKRAGLFLRKFLAIKFNKPVWSPKIYSIDEFMAELSGLSIAEPLPLLFELYGSYRELEGEKAQSPEEFFRWAPVLLQDFNEIESYCVDPGQLFSYLNEVRTIELWNPATGELTAFQKQYLHFWNSLGNLCNKFSHRLQQRKKGFHGMVFRAAAEKVNQSDLPGPFVFAGFNALTKSEELVIDFFLSKNKAEVFWDADNYYFKDKDQEAGKFLRKYLNSSGRIEQELKGFWGRQPVLPIEDDLSKAKKKYRNNWPARECNSDQSSR